MENDVYESSSILPRRVNEPPAVFSGCTLNETIAIVIGSFIFWVFFAITIGWLLGIFLIMLGATVILTLASTYGLAAWLRSVKQGKPIGYHGQKWRLFLEHHGLGVSHLYQANGELETGRSKQHISRHRLKRFDVDENRSESRGLET